MLTSLENREKFHYMTFEIECPLYYHKDRFCGSSSFVGFDTDEDREKFDKDWREVFAAAGWTIDGQDVRKGKSGLYVHPQQLIGTVSEQLESEVVSIVGNAKTFYLRKLRDGSPFVRRIEVKYDISAEEQLEHMRQRLAEIKESIVEAFRTKRKNLWWTDFRGKFSLIAEKFAVNALDQNATGEAVKFIEDVFHLLVSDGEILRREYKDGCAYRSLMKSERKNNMRARA